MGFPGSGLRLQPVTVASRIASRSFSDSTSTRRIVLSNVLEAHSSFFLCIAAGVGRSTKEQSCTVIYVNRRHVNK